MAALRKCVEVTACNPRGIDRQKILTLNSIFHRHCLRFGRAAAGLQKVNLSNNACTNGVAQPKPVHSKCLLSGTSGSFHPGSERKNVAGYFISRLYSTSSSSSTGSGTKDDKAKTEHVIDNVESIKPKSENPQPKVTKSTKSSNTTTVNSGGGTEGSPTKNTFKMPTPDLEWEYIINPDNEDSIQRNIEDRKGVGDVKKVKKLWNKLNYPEEIEDDDEVDKTQIKQQLVKEAMNLPNRTHPDVPIGDESQNRLVETVGTKRVFGFEPKGVVQLGEDLGMLRIENLGHTTGPKTYYLMGGFAQLEQALVRYTVNRLEKHGYTLISVPDLIHPDIVERCGFKTTGERTQVYKLDPARHGDMALAGTGEMPLAGMFLGQLLEAQGLPKKVMTVSRCFRAETSDVEEGIYRVHQFTKVESFGVTSQETGTESEELLREVLDIQKSLFSDLGLHFRILDMASQELGAPAYRKYDMETWMPAKQFWGEISSTSNCIDYQSRRLGIKYNLDGTIKHAHTINGTACAIPRMIMAIVENNQLEDGRVEIPEVLQPYMDDVKVLEQVLNPITSKWIKLTKLYKARTKSS